MLKFHKFPVKQECIPVGCIPPIAVAVSPAMHTPPLSCHTPCHACMPPAMYPLHGHTPPPRPYNMHAHSHACPCRHAHPPAIYAPRHTYPQAHTPHRNTHPWACIPPATDAPHPHTPWVCTPPCEQNDWQTGVKTLPCCNSIVSSNYGMPAHIR